MGDAAPSRFDTDYIGKFNQYDIGNFLLVIF